MAVAIITDSAAALPADLVRGARHHGRADVAHRRRRIDA